MPVPIPGPEVGSDSQKVKFLMIFGRPKTGFLDQISGVPGPFPQYPLCSYQPRSNVNDGSWVEITRPPRYINTGGIMCAGNPGPIHGWLDVQNPQVSIRNNKISKF